MATSEIKAKRTDPTIHVTHPDFTYQRGADVQATWRRFGWVPPSEGKAPPPPEKVYEEWHGVRRVK